jgi:phosphoribosylaminoimidazolecarboxamide formyltransferase/IMP cyclohydrolase
MSENPVFTPTLQIVGTLSRVLRYGENPHQRAAVYRINDARPGVLSAVVCQGKELSYNNILDADAAFECVAEFDVRNTKAVVIVKHQTPCGVAACNTFIESYARARACDPEAAYGGVIALNGVLDMPLAKMIAQSFVELIICPAVTDEALHVLRSKLALRILITGGMPDRANTEVSVRSVAPASP